MAAEPYRENDSNTKLCWCAKAWMSYDCEQRQRASIGAYRPTKQRTKQIRLEEPGLIWSFQVLVNRKTKGKSIKRGECMAIKVSMSWVANPKWKISNFLFSSSRSHQRWSWPRAPRIQVEFSISRFSTHPICTPQPCSKHSLKWSDHIKFRFQPVLWSFQMVLSFIFFYVCLFGFHSSFFWFSFLVTLKKENS